MNAAGSSTIGNNTSKRQNREPIIIDQQFSNAIDELINADKASKIKKNQTGIGNDYSPLYKDYHKSQVENGSSGKKQKKSLS